MCSMPFPAFDFLFCVGRWCESTVKLYKPLQQKGGGLCASKLGGIVKPNCRFADPAK